MIELKAVRTFILNRDEINTDKELIRILVDAFGDMPWTVNDVRTFNTIKLFYDDEKFSVERPDVKVRNVHYHSGVISIENEEHIKYLKTLIV